MLLLISVCRETNGDGIVVSFTDTLSSREGVVESSAHWDLQGRALDGRRQGGDARRVLHGGQNLGAVGLRRQNQRVRLQDLRLLDQNLMERHIPFVSNYIS